MVILVKLIATVNASPSYPTANIFTICSVKTNPKTDSTIHANMTKLNTLFINLRETTSPSSLCTSIYMGINTVAKVLPIMANITCGMFIAVT